MTGFAADKPLHDDRLTAAIAAAERWASFDPNPTTRSAVERLVDSRDPSLVSLFEARLSFGTAGLRAAVGPGPNRMNALVVRQTTAAVVSWLSDDRSETPLLVIGYDGRADSEAFARHAAAAALALGAQVELADQPAPTPVIAHRALRTQADAAIVITASHNPASDNGYKLYLGDGLQLVAPADEEIAARIDAMAAEWSQWSTQVDDRLPYARPTHAIEPWESDHRRDAVAAMLTTDRDVHVAYTPMHGVGGTAVARAFRSAGFADPVVVDEQFEPDPAFGTVAFPNPEEEGAMDLAIALASDQQADGVLANDPDADRLAIAVPDRDCQNFVALTGNEVGVLLADHILRHTSGERVVARSVVSTRLLDRMAAAEGDVAVVVTLTGFKWVARPIITHPTHRYVFGFEEALGYCIGSHVRDKDGITAALVAAELLAELKANGQTVWDRLDGLAVTHGVHLSTPITIRFDEEPSRVRQVVGSLQDKLPRTIAGVDITRSGPLGLGALPSTSGLHLELDDDTQIIVRPSGTEPKLKAYIEVTEPVESSLAHAQTAAARRMQRHADAVRELLR